MKLKRISERWERGQRPRWAESCKIFELWTRRDLCSECKDSPGPRGRPGPLGGCLCHGQRSRSAAAHARPPRVGQHSQTRWYVKDRKRFDTDEGKWEVSGNSSFRETLINLSLFKPYGANAISRLRTAQPRLLCQQTSFTPGSLLLSHRLCSIQRTAWLKRQER